MPSRPAVIGIVLFWLVVTAVVVNREVIPRFFGDEPPAPDFVAVDELSSATVNWTLYRGPADGSADEPIGKMTSRTEYVAADDSFRFVNTYRGVTLRVVVFDVTVPTATTAVRVSREGELREQSLRGTAELDLGRLVGAGAGVRKLTGSAEVDGVVRDGRLEGTASLTADLVGGTTTAAFTPVPVPHGQVLNPLMPVDRLRGVVPGRRWVVRQVDPLRDVIWELMLKGLHEGRTKLGEEPGQAPKLTLPPAPELLARVLREPVALDRPGGAVSCWVIEYESTDPPVSARTYVRRDDGRVLRQEATAHGERLRFERED